MYFSLKCVINVRVYKDQKLAFGIEFIKISSITNLISFTTTTSKMAAQRRNEESRKSGKKDQRWSVGNGSVPHYCVIM